MATCLNAVLALAQSKADLKNIYILFEFDSYCIIISAIDNVYIESLDTPRR